MFPEKRASTGRKAIEGSPVTYHLTGESTLAAASLPSPPTAKQPTIVRITHTNCYGPVDGAIFVRVGDPKSPLGAQDFDAVSDWTQAALVEEAIWDAKKEDWVPRPKRVADDTMWCATYDAPLQFTPGRHLIEIKFLSRHAAVCSIVLSDWQVRVK